MPNMQEGWILRVKTFEYTKYNAKYARLDSYPEEQVLNIVLFPKTGGS